MNQIEKIKKEKHGLELLNEFPRLAAMHANDLSDDDKQRIKWLGFWHSKDGTLMTRIRVSGGVATSAQLRVIAGIAQEFGHDLVDITTRAQIQLRYLSMQHIPIVFERLASVGLSSLQTGMDSIRNVVTSSVTGICNDEVVNALPVVHQVSEWITNGLAGNAATADLPRKMNIHITGHKHDMGASTNDIGLYPARKDARLGFNVMVGGAVGGKVPRLASELNVFVMPENVLEVVKGIVEIFDKEGPREERHKSRLKWLLTEWGEEKFRNELERHLKTTLETAGEDLRVAKPHLPLGVQRQKQAGLVYIGAHVPVGRTTGTALLELADLADRFGTGEARFTIEQNILLPNVSLEEIVGALEHPFFATHTLPKPPDRRRGQLHWYRILLVCPDRNQISSTRDCGTTPSRIPARITTRATLKNALVGLPTRLLEPSYWRFWLSGYKSQTRRRDGRRGGYFYWWSDWAQLETCHQSCRSRTTLASGGKNRRTRSGTSSRAF